MQNYLNVCMKLLVLALDVKLENSRWGNVVLIRPVTRAIVFKFYCSLFQIKNVERTNSFYIRVDFV